MKIPEGWPTEETPPAQEDEPVYQFNSAGDIWHDVDKNRFDYYTLNKFQTRILHTRPANDGLRKAAEEAAGEIERLREIIGVMEDAFERVKDNVSVPITVVNSLESALNKKTRQQ